MLILKFKVRHQGHNTTQERCRQWLYNSK